MAALLLSRIARQQPMPTLAQCVLMDTSFTRDVRLLFSAAVLPLRPVNAPPARQDTISMPQRLAAHASIIALPAMPSARLGVKLALRATLKAISVVLPAPSQIARLAQVEQEYVTNAIQGITSRRLFFAHSAVVIAKHAHLRAVLLAMITSSSVVLRVAVVVLTAKNALRTVLAPNVKLATSLAAPHAPPMYVLLIVKYVRLLPHAKPARLPNGVSRKLADRAPLVVSYARGLRRINAPPLMNHIS